MCFEELARRQPLVAERLRRTVRSGRLAHAYLFHGPPGSGRTAAAIALAQALNCQQKEATGCGTCESCRRIAAKTHPDVHWVQPESKSRRITRSMIVELEEALALKPREGRVKVGILVDADCMNDEAANAFLKTLEEPPGRTVLLLLTAEPQRLLPTIVSRCLKMPFATVGGGAVSKYRAALLPIWEQLAGATVKQVAVAYGALARLTALLREEEDKIRADAEKNERPDRWAELEPATRQRLEEQLAARIEGEYRQARDEMLQEMYRWFADVLLCVVAVEERFLEHRDALPILRRAAAGLTFAQAEAQLDAIEEVRDALARNVTETLALEVGLLKLLREG